jgi:hypothetical protein
MEGCKAEAIERGLSWNAEGQEFAGAWEVDGCFRYESSYENGDFNGFAYFGTGGTDETKTQDLCSPHIRLLINGGEE